MMPADRTGVVVIGSAHVDLIAVASRIPGPGESYVGTRFTIAPGGKAANQAAQIARMGAKAWLVAKVGDDLFGAMLVQRLAEVGVDTSLVHRDPILPTGASPIHVNNEGEYASVIVPGAAAALTARNVQQAASALRTSRIALLQLELPARLVQQAAEIALAEGCAVLLNVSPLPDRPEDLPVPLLRMATWLAVNRQELAAVAASLGIPPGDAPRAASAVRESLQISTVIVTLGAEGALAVTESETAVVPAPRVTVVDTIGAGDAFLGTVAAALAGGSSLHGALRRGCASGALAATRAGAFDGLPDAAGLEAFMTGDAAC
jgi:ribokinase